MTQETKEEARQTDLEAVLAALTSNERFLVVTHENPDGDALGSMLAMALGLRALGKDALMYLAGSVDLPAEFGFLALDEVGRELPEDIGERALVAVDCANARRIGPDPALLDLARVVVDVDHHHDNTRFGSANLIDADASSTAEIVRDLLWELGVALTPDIAEALYVGLVTDTGRFQYSNTTPKAFRLAAELVEAGADVHGIFRSVYETVQFAKLKLLARALGRAQLYEGGRLLVSHLLRTDFEEVGAEEPYSEGIIDYLRQAEGAQMVALIREPPGDGGPSRRVSLRSSQDEVDVSAVARQAGGGGHRQAAGFSSELSVEEISEFIRREFVASAGGQRAAGAAAGE
jgi:phosphoesterase RecJ-like protein